MDSIIPILKSTDESTFVGKRPGFAQPSALPHEYEKYILLARYVHRECVTSKWLDGADYYPQYGVAVRRPDLSFAFEPGNLDPEFCTAVEKINPSIAFAMSSDVTAAVFRQLTPYQTEINIGHSNARFPIIESLEYLTSGDKNILDGSYACLVKKEKIVICWTDSVESILMHGADVETKLIATMWGSQIAIPSRTYQRSASMKTPYQSGFVFDTPPSVAHSSVDEKKEIRGAVITVEEDFGLDVIDPDIEAAGPLKRPMVLTHSFIVSLAMIVIAVAEINWISVLISEYVLDNGKLRFALTAVIPIFITFALFFMIIIMSSLFQIFGPVSDIMGNSRYHSAIAPKPEKHQGLELPHITIQIPVYKEGLKAVILPTIASLVAAVRYYENVGGTASIYVNEDGMQVINPAVAEARQQLYAANNIGWCARPPHNKDGFLRKGKFKKASNMNYCLDFSIRVEDELLRLIQERANTTGCSQDDISLEDEEALYRVALDTVINADEGRTMASGNVRIGELILIVDCDTRVPVDCLLLGALEMHESPEVAILQHASGVMQVVHNLFENAITYFTEVIYISIQFAVGSGDVGPFVGHNAFLRWKAVQSVSFQEDGQTKFWSDNTVSEDFDLSLRLQIQKFVVRLASYHHGGFKEGVSLTVYDELARWEKYAYGCNELVFHPLYKWIYRGPFTRLFLRFMWSDMKPTSKITILAYVFTYYAIASAFPLALANYFLVGWQVDVDQFYWPSWKNFIGILVVFNALCALAFSVIRERLHIKKFLPALLETMKWTPLFILFFSGVSIHLSKAILSHFFSINMEWTSTAKELEATGFFIGMDKIVKDFKYMYVIVFGITGGMIYLGVYAPIGWKITDFTAIVPLATQVVGHFLLPVVLGLF